MGIFAVCLLEAVSRAVMSSRQLACIDTEVKEGLVFPERLAKVVPRLSFLMRDMTIRT
jgi:hypothetical protein